MHVRSFDPVAGERPLVLVLGSMPGIESLRAGEYYAHPRNTFWRILGDLGLCDPSDTYPLRIASLKRANVALWDVLATCQRIGSLDASIERESEVPNDISAFLVEHPSLRALYFNGSKAEQAFRAHIAAGLPPDQRESLTFQRLPSTSPAHAIPYSQKFDAWRAILERLALNKRRPARLERPD